MSSRWKERNVKTRRDRRCEENPCQSEEGALAWDRQLCLGQWRWMRKGWRQLHERRAKECGSATGARGSAELRKVASGSATQGFWLRNGKVGSQVSGVDQC